MARKARQLLDLEFDEISLVDKGANQHAKTVIAKRHDEEDNMDVFDEKGNPIDADSIEPGDVVYSAEGEAFEAVLDDDDDSDGDLDFSDEYEDEPQLVGVGKSYDLREALSKAMSDEERDEIYTRAINQLAQSEQVAKAAALSAENERQLRLDREYTDIAKNYNVGIAPEDLGPVLKRLAENMDPADCVIIAKALDSVSGMSDIFDEIGVKGAGDNSDIFQQVQAHADSYVGKTAEGESREQLISKTFEMNPEAYDQYLSEAHTR